LKHWWIVLAFIVFFALFSETAPAQTLSVGLKIPIEFQTLSVEHFYDNFELTSAFHWGELWQIELRLLVPVSPIFAAFNIQLSFLRMESLNFYAGAGLIYTSVITESLWGGQGFLGADWRLADWPVSLSIELGSRVFTIFLGTYSGLFLNLGARLNF
jgi:hypothetical protein